MIRRPPRSTLFPYRRSSDLENWQWLPSGGIDFRDIWAMAVHPTRANEIYVGTLPAAIYVSENGGRSFLELSALRNLPEYNKWTFPPAAPYASRALHHARRAGARWNSRRH